jgi:hypothetical protein
VRARFPPIGRTARNPLSPVAEQGSVGWVTAQMLAPIYYNQPLRLNRTYRSAEQAMITTDDT